MAYFQPNKKYNHFSLTHNKQAVTIADLQIGQYAITDDNLLVMKQYDGKMVIIAGEIAMSGDLFGPNAKLRMNPLEKGSVITITVE